MHTIHQHLFRDFSPFHLPVKEKQKQEKMKGFTMVQWINLNQNNISVLVLWCSILWEKIGPILLPLVDLMAGRAADEIIVGGFQNFKNSLQVKLIVGGFQNFKNSLQVKLFGLLICLLSLQCYYSIRNAFQSAFIK